MGVCGPHSLGPSEGKGCVDMLAAGGQDSSLKVVILNFSELQLSPVKWRKFPVASMTDGPPLEAGLPTPLSAKTREALLARPEVPSLGKVSEATRLACMEVRVTGGRDPWEEQPFGRPSGPVGRISKYGQE